MLGGQLRADRRFCGAELCQHRFTVRSLRRLLERTLQVASRGLPGSASARCARRAAQPLDRPGIPLRAAHEQMGGDLLGAGSFRLQEPRRRQMLAGALGRWNVVLYGVANQRMDEAKRLSRE